MIRQFMQKNFKHFNAASCVGAAEGWNTLLEEGGKMFVTLAGAMSTAELGITLAEMIRKDKIGAICCTGANLEEDLFNLVAHSQYVRIPHYRYLTLEEEEELAERNLNRVTDTCIPEEEAMRRVEKHVLKYWKQADEEGTRAFPHEFLFHVIKNNDLESEYETDPKNSWLIAACEKKIPIFVPGWEDSTLGNFFVACSLRAHIRKMSIIKSGLEYMRSLVAWYKSTSSSSPIGFFQIGGGIAGDFPICVVPLIRQDLKEECSLWAYFCQISDSTTSYGSYSGATPNEKITWGKIGKDTPHYIIESDATIIAPLIFRYVLESGAVKRDEKEAEPAFAES